MHENATVDFGSSQHWLKTFQVGCRPTNRLIVPFSCSLYNLFSPDIDRPSAVVQRCRPEDIHLRHERAVSVGNINHHLSLWCWTVLFGRSSASAARQRRHPFNLTSVSRFSELLCPLQKKSQTAVKNRRVFVPPIIRSLVFYCLFFCWCFVLVLGDSLCRT